MIFTLALAAAAMTGQLSHTYSEPDGSGDAIQRVLVHYDDLDLATRDGAATLNRRIWKAAQQICIPTNPGVSMMSLDLGGCLEAVTGSARGQLAAALARARASRKLLPIETASLLDQAK